mmetsp:Transcript_9551/g.33276  ORF Transcript_9551/g.33276 Transcript_9551/m.33276 type:complete len:249 (+) Transcript_9551:536-1282(+)
MMHSARLRGLRPSCEVSTPSIRTRPDSSSTRRNSAAASVDLPAPVRPHTPSLSPPATSRSRPRRASGRPGAYRRLQAWNWTRPALGHAPGLGSCPGRSAGGSTGASHDDAMRSTFTRAFSRSEKVLTTRERDRVEASTVTSTSPAAAAGVLLLMAMTSSAVMPITTPPMSCVRSPNHWLRPTVAMPASMLLTTCAALPSWKRASCRNALTVVTPCSASLKLENTGDLLADSTRLSSLLASLYADVSLV